MKTKAKISKLGRGRRTLVWAITAAFVLNNPAYANPQGPQVVQGKVDFSNNGKTLTITNSPNAIINWQNFSINADETTRFLQNNANSSVLNRVTGSYSSQILGALQSNGKVFLINPNGILFGNGARVDVQGLVASSLALSNEDFNQGRQRFGNQATAGNALEVKNQGRITTPSGGQVFLLAPNVENSGVISTPGGQVVLAAGHSVHLVDSGNPDLHVVVSAPNNAAVNLGQIISQGGRIGIYGALINQRGVVNANSAVLGENGKIVLKASRDAVLENGSLTTATGVGVGGNIAVLGDMVIANGTATVDVSGGRQGGVALLGGDYQGKNAAVKNASQTFIGNNASIKADALVEGDGGKVIVWSDKLTQAYGSISAQGKGNTAKGGFVEVSGKQNLNFKAKVKVGGGLNGKGGTLLLDPATITIKGGDGDGAGANGDGIGTFQGGSNVGEVAVGDSLSNIYQSELEGIGAGSTIVLEAADFIDTFGTFANNKINLSNNTNLVLRTRNLATAPNMGINLTNSNAGANLEIAANGSGSISLEAGGGSSLGGDIHAGKLSTTGGALTMTAKGDANLQGAVATQGGNIFVEVGKDINVNGNVNSGSGTIKLNTKVADKTITIGNTGSLQAASTDLTKGIELISDNLDIAGTVSVSGNGAVKIKPQTGPRNIAITNTQTRTDLEISAAQINRISAHNLFFDSAGNQRVDEALVASGVQRINIFGDSVVINQPLSVTASDGLINLAGNTITLGAAAGLSTTGGASQISLFADNINFGGVAGAINAGAGTVAIAPKTVSKNMDVGVISVARDGFMSVQQSDLQAIHAGALAFGKVKPDWNGGLTVVAGGLDLTSGNVSGPLYLSGGNLAPLAVEGDLKANGLLELHSPHSITTGAGSSIHAAEIHMVADRMNLQGGTGSISAGSGLTWLKPLSSGWKLELGNPSSSDSVSQTLELSNAELNTVGGSGTLRVGALNSGDMMLVGAINPTFSGTLSLRSGTDIGQTSGSTVSANKLSVQAIGHVDLTEANQVAKVAGLVGDNDNKNGHFKFTSTQALEVGANLDGRSGIAITQDMSQYDSQNPTGVIALTSSGALTQAAGTLLTGKALYLEGKSVSITSDNPTGVVAGKATGTDSGDVFHFKTVNPLQVSVVNGFHGIAQQGQALGNAIRLQGVGVGQTSDASITTAGGLMVESNGGVFLDQASGNQVGALAVAASGPVNFSNTGDLRIGTNSVGITSTNGNIHIATSGNLGVKHDVNAGTGNLSLSGANLLLGYAGHNGVNITGKHIALLTNAADGKLETDGTTSNIGSAASDGINIVADHYDFSKASPAFSTNTANGMIAVRNQSDNHEVELLHPATWSADAIAIGESDPSKSYTTGNIVIGAPLAANHVGLFSGAAISQHPSTGAITANMVGFVAGTVNANGGVTLNNPANVISSIAGQTFGGAFNLRNNAPLTISQANINANLTLSGISTQNGALSIDNTGAIVINHPLNSGTGDINVIARSPLTVNSAVTAGGNIDLEAGSSNSSTDKLIVTAQGSVVSSGGNVRLKAGDSILIANPSSVSAPNGNVTQSPNNNVPPLPSLSQCISNPALNGCDQVLPTISACTATPTLPGCSVVLPNLSACIASPSLPGCSAVLPNLSACTATPTLPGCSVVLPNITACIATPSLPGCSAVLPNLTACIGNPTLPGCSVVLPNIAACIATPSLPGCSVVLPNLTACIATPTLPGCSAVLPNLTACISTPSLPGCSVVLPNLTACLATPSLPGCSAVLPSLTACIATPSLPGCSVVLPNLTACIATPSLPGCSVVLPNLTACIATPSLPGCSAVLPNLSACVSTPTLPGCSVILPPISACIDTPSLPGCTAVLPNLTTCIASPSSAGCQVVLPSLSACIATPSLPGCSVILPSLASCINSPSLPGCAVVLPSLAACRANSTLPGCSVVLPVTQQSGQNEPVAQVVESTLSIINNVSDTGNKVAEVSKVFTDTKAAKSDTSNSKTSSVADTKLAAADDTKTDAKAAVADKVEEKKDEKKEEKKDDKKDNASNKDSGAKKDEPAKKLYCN